MTQDFKDLLYLFSCGAKGITPNVSHEIDILKIHNLALSQGIWGTVYLAIKELYDSKKINFSKEIMDTWKKEVMWVTLNGVKRNKFIYETVKQLEDDGIKCCYLKGEAISRLYHTPICRMSSDTDILIDKKDENKLFKILKKNGYSVERKLESSHHIVSTHPISGIVEFHTSMYSEATEDIILDGKVKYNEGYIKVKLEDGDEITTLGINDGILFLTIHFIKHFIGRGAGIRQLMDLLLYISYYKNEINWESYISLIKYLKYETLLSSIYGIGVKYLNFSTDELPGFSLEENLSDKILTDIEIGGIFGHADNQRADFYSLYIKERFNTFKTGDFNEYMNKSSFNSMKDKLFPTYGEMVKRYPYIEKSKFLLPFAWISRLLKLSLSVLKREKTLKEYVNYKKPEYKNEVTKERMNLMRELKMI